MVAQVICTRSGRRLSRAHVSGVVSGVVSRGVCGVVHADDPLNRAKHARHCSSRGVVAACRHIGGYTHDSEIDGSVARRGGAALLMASLAGTLDVFAKALGPW
jgi:hypothetical protein